MKNILIELWRFKWIVALLWVTSGGALFYWATYEREGYQAEAVLHIGYLIQNGKKKYFDNASRLETLLAKKYSYINEVRCESIVEAITVYRLRVNCYGRNRSELEKTIDSVINYVTEKHHEDYMYLKSFAEAEMKKNDQVGRVLNDLNNLLSTATVESMTDSQRLLFFEVQNELIKYNYEQELLALQQNGLAETHLKKNGLQITSRPLSNKKTFVASFVIFVFGLFGAVVAYAVERALK